MKQKANFESGSNLVRPMKPFCADPNDIDMIVKTIARDAYPESFSVRMQKNELFAEVKVFPCRRLCRLGIQVKDNPIPKPLLRQEIYSVIWNNDKECRFYGSH